MHGGGKIYSLIYTDVPILAVILKEDYAGTAFMNVMY